MERVKIAGINFDHFHMGDLLREAHEHGEADIVAVCDAQPDRMRDAVAAFDIPSDRVFTDAGACLQATEPDLVILCPAAAEHGEWVQRVAPYDVHILLEKPFAATLAEADDIIDAMRQTGRKLAINWPLAWYPTHRTTKRLIDEGRIGRVLEVHYYDGNRGPLWHTADKVERTVEQVQRDKPHSWFYKRSAGGGSLLDYMGYGTTLGTWFMDGRKPIEVTCTVDEPPGLEVDEHAVAIARYETGLSKFETRWGTFTDPWTHQPQPRCGFVIVGTEGTISSYSHQPVVTVQDRAHPEGRAVPVDELRPPFQNPVQYMVDAIVDDRPVEGPLSPTMSRIGQQIVDTAVRSTQRKATVKLLA